MNRVNCWILTTPRSGSTYLYRLLNDSKLIQDKFDEYFNTDKYPEIVKLRKDYFKDRLPVCSIIHTIQFEYVGFGINDKKTFESRLSNLRFIYLFRENHVDNALSKYFAKYTNIWSLAKDTDNSSYFEIKIPYDYGKIKECYLRSLYDHNFWKRYLDGSSYLTVTYDDLINRTNKELAKVFNYLDVDCSGINLNQLVSGSKTVPMVRPEKNEYYDKFLIDSHKDKDLIGKV